MELTVESPCHHVQWKVQDFFQLPSEIGSSLDSSKFSIADDSYCLRLYPNGSQRYEYVALIEIQLVRVTSTFPEWNISCKIGHRRRNGNGDEIDEYCVSSALNNRIYYLRCTFEADRDECVPGDTLTVLCSIISREQSSGESPQSDAEVEHEGLTGKVFFGEELRRSVCGEALNTAKICQCDMPCLTLSSWTTLESVVRCLSVPESTRSSSPDIRGLRSHFELDLKRQSVFFSSRWRSHKMELSIESPCQHITWKVPNFFELISENGYSLNSPEFRFADDRYCLQFYPKGDAADFELQLVRLTSTFPERIVLYKVGYTGKTIGLSDFDSYDFSGTLIDEFGFCLSRSQFEEERDLFVSDGTLTVLCFMRLGEQSSAGSRQSEEVGNSDAEENQIGLRDVSKLQSDYRQLLQKGAESDACLVVAGKEFRAHRCVLRARSDVFNAMFDHETAEKESGRVDINDLDPDSFGEFLEYLYTGGVEAGISDENAFWLYAAAEKYDVSTLRSACVAHMRRTLSVNSFCDVMTLALRHREEDLMQHAIQFFKENLQRIIVTAKWQQFVIDNGTSANELFVKALVPRGQ